MSFKSLMFDENQDMIAEDAEKAFRRIAAQKLRDRNCQEAEIKPSIERLLTKSMGLKLEV